MTSPRRRIAPVRHTLLVRIFELDGFGIVRTRGDHIVMTKPDVRRPVVIKRSTGVVPVAHIMTNMRTAGMSRDRFFELLQQAG